MSIFRRKPKFRVGDRVQVTSLVGCSRLARYVGRVGEVAGRVRINHEWRYVGRLDDGTSIVFLYEWELRPA